MLSDSFMADFCNKLNREGLWIEIAEAEAGTCNFNTAKHYETLSPNDLHEILTKKSTKNLSFASGIKPRQGLKRCSSKDIASRSLIPFDIDLKDQDEGFAALDRDSKLNRVRAIFDANKQKIEAVLGDIWGAVYSGNGLHLYFHSSDPIDCSDEKQYEAFYSQCLTALESNVPLRFDPAFKKPGQLIRLPGSLNLKNKLAPLATEVIYRNEKSDSSSQLHAAFNDAATQLAAQKVIHLHRPEPLNSDDHKANLKAALTFENVLGHFGYDKWNLAQKNRTVISAPWRADKNPSVHLDHAGKFFNDFGDSSKKGDVFNMIAECSGLNIKTQFPDVIKIAEEITGIEKPKKAKVAREKSGTEQVKKPRPTSAEYNEFFYRHLPRLSKELLSHNLVYMDHGQWRQAMNMVRALEALVIEEGRVLKTTDVIRFLSLLQRDAEPKLIIDIPEWDGVDRINTIAQCLKAKNVSSEQLEDLLKEWGAKMFERVEDPSVQNPMLIFTGGQGIGKSALVKAMLGGLDHYFKSGRIGADDKDDDLRLTKTIAWCIDEFDQTKKADVARLKELIFRESVTFRAPYAAAEEKIICRYSFMATANVSDLLRDSTGNRRYRIIELEAIEWGYPTNESPQILAQFKALKGHRIAAETKATIDAYTEAATPPSIEEQIISVFDELMTPPAGYPNIPLVKRGEEATDLRVKIQSILKASGQYVSDRKISVVLKDSGRSRRGTGNVNEYFLPESSRGID